MKPKLLLCPGMARSGTTTLWKLLDDNNLINGMQHKETHYLKILCDMRDGNTDNIYPQEIKDSWRKSLVIENKDCLGLKLPYTFKDYKCYLYDNLKNKNQAIADFSQTISILPSYFLKEIKDNLSDDFDIRIIILFRDPIKRLFSHCVHLYKSGWYRTKDDWTNIIKPPRDLFLDSINRKQFQNLYVDVKNKFEEIFSNVIFFSTEKFYTTQTEHNRLSDFLDAPKIYLSNIYENRTKYEDNITSSDIELASKKLLPSIEIHQEL